MSQAWWQQLMASQVGTFIGGLLGGLILSPWAPTLSADRSGVAFRDMDRELRREFAENIERMRAATQAIYDKKPEERTHRDKEAIVKFHVIPHSRITIAGHDWVVYCGEGKTVLLPMQEFKDMEAQRKEMLKQHEIYDQVRPFATQNCDAYDRDRVEAAWRAAKLHE
jgi:hypothetical protein